jgi:transposase
LLGKHLPAGFRYAPWQLTEAYEWGWRRPYSRWFERLLAELGFEVWIGDPAEIQAKRVKKQKTDRQDAQLLLKLLMEDRFPRIWVPSAENRDVRQLLWHRHRLVQMRTRIMNQLPALAMNEGRARVNGQLMLTVRLESRWRRARFGGKMYLASHVERPGSNWVGRIDDDQNIDSGIRAQRVALQMANAIDL